MILKNLKRSLLRYLFPCFARSLYYSFKYRCLVSPRADIQLSRLIRLGPGTDIRPYVRIITTEGPITLGRHCGINSFSFISTGNAFVKIGNNVRIGPHVTIVASGRNIDDTSRPLKDVEKIEKGITIEDNVLIGASVVVLDGVTIGQGAVIGAGAIVTHNIPPYAVAVGNPARVTRTRGTPRP